MGSSTENSAFHVTRNPWDESRVPGRLVGRLGGGGRRTPAAGGDRHRHRRLDPPAGELLRHHRHQADLRRLLALRDDRLRVEPRPGRRARAQRRGLRARARRDERVRPARLDQRRAAAAGLPRRARQGARRRVGGASRCTACASACRRNSSRRRWPATSSSALRAALAEMARLGATLVDVQLPRTELSIPVYYLIAPAEASSNLSRFDGVRYGHRAEHYEDLQSMYRTSRSEGFGPEVKRRIMIGTYVLSHGYYDAYYLQAQKLRRMIADDFQACFRECDVIAGPVAPTVAWPLGAQSDDPVANYLADIFTLPASLAGLPGMSIPAGFGAGGMPVGLQLVGNYFAEGTLLHAAHAFQRATDWHLRAPRPADVTIDRRRRRHDPRLRGRDRHRDARAAVDALEDLQRRVDRVRRRAEHAGVGGRPRPARHAAGRQPRRGRAGDPLRPGGRRDDRAGVDLRAQELLLPRPAQGLPDQPVRDAGRPGRRGRVLRRRRRAPGPADARPSRGGRRQVAARRRPRRRRAAAARRSTSRATGPGST